MVLFRSPPSPLVTGRQGGILGNESHLEFAHETLEKGDEMAVDVEGVRFC